MRSQYINRNPVLESAFRHKLQSEVLFPIIYSTKQMYNLAVIIQFLAYATVYSDNPHVTFQIEFNEANLVKYRNTNSPPTKIPLALDVNNAIAHSNAESRKSNWNQAGRDAGFFVSSAITRRLKYPSVWIQAVVLSSVESQRKITKQSVEKYENTQGKHMSVRICTVGLSWLARSGYRGIDVTGTLPRLLNRNSPAHRISYAMKSYETNNETTRSSRHTCIPMTHQMLIKRSQRILIDYINNAFVLKCFIARNFCLSPSVVLFHLNDSEVGVSIRLGEPAPVSAM